MFIKLLSLYFFSLKFKKSFIISFIKLKFRNLYNFYIVLNYYKKYLLIINLHKEETNLKINLFCKLELFTSN